jgi:hypothetical protein
MVFVRITRITVRTETLITRIVIMADTTPPPTAAALDTKMVVALACQLAISGSAFQQSLRQRYTSRNLMKLHLLHSQITILIYIFYVTGISSLRLRSYCKEENHSKKDQSIQFVLHFISDVDYKAQKSEK